MSDIFSPGALAKATHATLEDAYAAIPPGHTKAFILDGTYAKGAGIQGAYVQRSADNTWGVVIEGGYNGTEGAHGGFHVAWSGK